MIIPKVRDPRFATIHRGGTLTDLDHHLLALWAALCAERVLDLFESAQPGPTTVRRSSMPARGCVARSRWPRLARPAAMQWPRPKMWGAARHPLMLPAGRDPDVLTW